MADDDHDDDDDDVDDNHTFLLSLVIKNYNALVIKNYNAYERRCRGCYYCIYVIVWLITTITIMRIRMGRCVIRTRLFLVFQMTNEEEEDNVIRHVCRNKRKVGIVKY